MGRSLRLAVAACAALGTLAFAGSAWAAYTPSLVSVSLTNGAGKPTTMLLGHIQGVTDDPTQKDTIYAPAGYGINLTAAQNTKIGDVSSTWVLRNSGNQPIDVDGQIIVDSPANYPAASNTCTPGLTHEAVWRLDITVQAMALHIPIYVDRVTTGPDAAFASAKIELCLPGPIVGTPSGAHLTFALFDVNRVFTNPPSTADRVWHALFTPYTPGTPDANPAGTTEGQAVVPGRVSLTLKSQSKRRGVVIITGKLLVDGRAFQGATIELYVGNKKVGSAKTKGNGTFTIRKRIKKKTRYRALTSFVGSLASCPAPALPAAPLGCKTATLSFVAISNTVTARRKR
jgi:hypothetical protein